MSYLDLPRLHFSGLFFTNPNTINNVTQNYTPGISFENPPPAPPDQYNMEATGDPGASGWNPMGVAQWWLEECTVLSAVGTGGVEVDASDAVIGALVESPSPKTPMSDGQGGFYDIAKMVDLDPDQQGRSALYGLRIAITLPNGAGLQGLMTVPEIRQLNPRIANPQSSWSFVCNWMGTLQDVQWSGDISGSPLLTALQAAGGQGLAVKLTVDLHQNNPGNVFTEGNTFFYGRVLGSIGPALAGELAQVLPGRCLQKFTPAVAKADPQAVVQSSQGEVLQGRDLVMAQVMALGASRAALSTAAAATAPPDPWNPAFAIIRQIDSQQLLSLDIGGCMLLNSTADPTDPSGVVSDGTFEVDSGIVVGAFDLANSKFVPFASGEIAVQYQALESSAKNCNLVPNSGVFTIPLTANEATLCLTNPLAIQVNGTTVAQEYTSGYWIDVSVSSQRLECGSGQTGTAQIMVRQFGKAVVGVTPPVTSNVQLIDWNQSGGFSPSNDVGISFGQTDANGLADITTTVNVADIALPPVRQPLDSQIYFILMRDTNKRPVGDGGPQTPGLSILLWSAFQAPSSPTWKQDISPVFTAYARLYPGMKSRLDISDEATVLGFAPVIHAMMSQDISEPSYMPVTRDISPSKMAMIVSWLKQVSQK